MQVEGGGEDWEGEEGEGGEGSKTGSVVGSRKSSHHVTPRESKRRSLSGSKRIDSRIEWI